MKSLRIFLLVVLSVNLFAQDPVPKAKNGVLDARAWDFTQQKLALDGVWSFYKSELIQVSDSIKKSPAQSNFPEIWGEDIQYGTYQLLVLLPPDTGRLAFEIPQMYCSYELWMNDKKIAENGTVGNSKETTKPQWLPQAVSFTHPGDTALITLKISNFYHFKGGAKEKLYLGQAATVMEHQSVAVKSNLVEAVVLAVLGLGFFVIYYVREERKKITLYFSLLCLTWAIRAGFSNMYVFISYFPDFHWALLLRIEYITLFLTMIWAILFLSRLFPNESSNTIKYLLVGTNCFFAALTTVSSPLFFTQWLNVYLGVAGILLLFGGVIVIRALINERSGVWYLVVCVFLSIALFSYDIIVFEGFFSHYDAVLFSSGYIVMFLMMGVALLYHLRIFKGEGSSGMLTYEDLYGKGR